MYKVQANKFRPYDRPNLVPPPSYYTTPSGVRRVRTLHPTKGWRDRNINSLLQSAVRSLTGDQAVLVPGP